MEYKTAMEKLAELLGRETYEIPHVEADIAFSPVAEAFYDHSKWHEDTQDWTEFRTFKHAFETATDNQEEAYIALMDSLNMDFTG
jgi:hypothetical protein|uniref:Uncharacterized protein n=1 Tax=viral metagenome TaxID=1070528 RepID=A0A6C0AHM8_9ZZZZ